MNKGLFGQVLQKSLGVGLGAVVVLLTGCVTPSQMPSNAVNVTDVGVVKTEVKRQLTYYLVRQREIDQELETSQATFEPAVKPVCAEGTKFYDLVNFKLNLETYAVDDGSQPVQPTSLKDMLMGLGGGGFMNRPTRSQGHMFEYEEWFEPDGYNKEIYKRYTLDNGYQELAQDSVGQPKDLTLANTLLDLQRGLTVLAQSPNTPCLAGENRPGADKLDRNTFTIDISYNTVLDDTGNAHVALIMGRHVNNDVKKLNTVTVTFRRRPPLANGRVLPAIPAGQGVSRPINNPAFCRNPADKFIYICQDGFIMSKAQLMSGSYVVGPRAAAAASVAPKADASTLAPAKATKAPRRRKAVPAAKAAVPPPASAAASVTPPTEKAPSMADDPQMARDPNPDNAGDANTNNNGNAADQ